MRRACHELWRCCNRHAAAAAAKSLQSCTTLCDPIDSSPPGSSVPGILQARVMGWVAISFSDRQTCFNLMFLIKLANNVLSDNLNITRSYLINIECQFSYQHLTFIMLNDILVSDLEITGASVMKSQDKSEKWRLSHTFPQILVQHSSWQRASDCSIWWPYKLIKAEVHNEINALMNMYGWRSPSVLHQPLFFQQLTNTQLPPMPPPCFRRVFILSF